MFPMIKLTSLHDFGRCSADAGHHVESVNNLCIMHFYDSYGDSDIGGLNFVGEEKEMQLKK